MATGDSVLNASTPGSPPGNQSGSASEIAGSVVEELERRRRDLQSRADRAEVARELAERERDVLKAELDRSRLAATPIGNPVPQTQQVAPPQAPSVPPNYATQLAELQVRLERAERREKVDTLFADPANADVAHLRSLVPNTMSVDELPAFIIQLRAIAPQAARQAISGIVAQAAGVQQLTTKDGKLLPPATVNVVGGYVPPQLAAGGVMAISAGGAPAAPGTGTPDLAQIDAAFEGVKPGDKRKIWDTVHALVQRIPRPSL